MTPAAPPSPVARPLTLADTRQPLHWYPTGDPAAALDLHLAAGRPEPQDIFQDFRGCYIPVDPKTVADWKEKEQ